MLTVGPVQARMFVTLDTYVRFGRVFYESPWTNLDHHVHVIYLDHHVLRRTCSTALFLLSMHYDHKSSTVGCM